MANGQQLSALPETAIGAIPIRTPENLQGRIGMPTGPVEYLAIAFPDGDVNDEIAAELASLVDRKVIRILDAVVVTKDAVGDVTAAEFDEDGDLSGFMQIDAEVVLDPPLIGGAPVPGNSRMRLGGRHSRAQPSLKSGEFSAC